MTVQMPHSNHDRDEDDPYAHIARWYDVEHDQFEDDLQFYLDLSAGTGPSILDVGCGTGRVAVALARAGRQVTGIDRSAAMLARAHERLAREPETVRSRVSLRQADARMLAGIASGHFALAIIPLNTLAHLHTLADRSSLLAGVHAQLVPGGRLVVDLDVQGPRRLLDVPGQLIVQGVWPVNEDCEDSEHQVVSVSHFVACVGPPVDDVLRVTHFYDALERTGIVRRSISQMGVALLTRGEVDVTLDRAGFEVEAVYGSYDLAPYDYGADRAIFLAHSRQR